MIHLKSLSTLVARQKGKSQNAYFKKTKHAEFSKKRTFLPPDTHTYVRSFFGKFDVIHFPETPVLRFTLLPYYQ